MEREFSLDEARALLPELTTRLTRLIEAQEALARTPTAGMAPGNGTSHLAVATSQAREEFVAALEAVQELGVVIRDPASGLVDFPARRRGEPVYLCWRIGEPEIAHWHSRDGGFAGRQPL